AGMAETPLRYSVGGGQLSPSDRLFYEKNGFIVVKGLVPEHCVRDYIARFQEICAGAQRPPGLTVMRDVSALDDSGGGERAVYKLQDFQNDDRLFAYCQLPQVLDYVVDIIGPDVAAMHTMLISKPPDRGTLSSRHPLHQDLYYFPFRPADRVVCAWTALEPVTRANGCLVAVPGSHLDGRLLPHDYPNWGGKVNKAFHGIVDLDPGSLPLTYLEMSAGDTVLFHPLLIHGSGANRTEGYRKAISCHYASAHVEYIDVTGTHQQKIADEVDEIVRQRLGPDAKLSYEDVWRLRARHVRGREAKL
ncbi:hypothetical protein BOX15_Mlig014171g1, partial [Macrostomum lignano]